MRTLSKLVIYQIIMSNLHFSAKTCTVFIRINAPFLLVPPPPPPPPPPPLSTFAKFIFRGFTSLSTASTFAIPAFRKKMRFSTSQIEYRLREIKKVATKQSNYDHKRNEICKIMI